MLHDGHAEEIIEDLNCSKDKHILSDWKAESINLKPNAKVDSACSEGAAGHDKYKEENFEWSYFFRNEFLHVRSSLSPQLVDPWELILGKLHLLNCCFVRLSNAFNKVHQVIHFSVVIEVHRILLHHERCRHCSHCEPNDIYANICLPSRKIFIENGNADLSSPSSTEIEQQNHIFAHIWKVPRPQKESQNCKGTVTTSHKKLWSD